MDKKVWGGIIGVVGLFALIGALEAVMDGARPEAGRERRARECTQAAELAEAVVKARDRGVTQEAAIAQALRAPDPKLQEAALDFVQAAYSDRSMTIAQAGRATFDGCIAPKGESR